MAYQTHPLFQQPDDPESPVWRYMTLAKYLSILESGTLWFSRSDRLAGDDPFEGQFAKPNYLFDLMTWSMASPREWEAQGFQSESELTEYMRIRPQLRESNLLLREIHFINCWHMNPDESDAMWKIYSKGSDAVCIQSTFDRLTRSFSDAEDSVYVGKVNYVDYDRDFIDETNSFAPYLHKRAQFRHESEVRAIISRINERGMHPTRFGISVPVDLQCLVSAIYISPTSESWLHQLIEGVQSKFGYSFRVCKSELSKRPWRFDRTANSR